MSFTLTYERLLGLRVEEEGGGPLSAFTFAPDGRTVGALADHQLVFRPRQEGFDLYYRLNPEAPSPLLGAIRTRVRFGFEMRLAESDFFARYEPDLSGDTGPQLYLDNLTAAGAVQPNGTAALSEGPVVQDVDGVKIYPRIFQVQTEMGGGAPPTRLIVREKFDPTVVVVEVPIVPGGGTVSTWVDLSAHPGGPYTVETDGAGATARTIYVDDELAGRRMTGLVDLYWEDAQDSAPTGGVAYTIPFRKR